MLLAHAFLFACLLQLVAGHALPAYKRFENAIQLPLAAPEEAPRIGAQVLAHGDLVEALRVVLYLGAESSRVPGTRQHAALNDHFITKAVAARPSNEREILLAVWLSAEIEEGVDQTPIARLAERDPPLPGAAFAAGLVAQELFADPEAELWFSLEHSPLYAPLARQREFAIIARQGPPERVEAFLEKEEYYDVAPLDVRMLYDVEQGQWWRAVITGLAAIHWDRNAWQSWAISLLAATVWSIIVLRLANVSALRDPALPLSFAAILLGIFSTALTLVVLTWQELRFGLVRDGTLVGDFLYCFLGVGLREEFLKMICALPILWFLRGDRDDRRVLLIGAMTGLGFALAENLSYVELHNVGVGFTRFLSANFLHLATTALVAQGLVTWLRHPTRGLDHFLFRFTAIVLIHGGYDFFLIHAGLREYQIFSLIMLGGLAYWYFHIVRLERQQERMTIALPAIFIWGLVGLIGAGYVLCSWDFGLFTAFRIMLETFISSALLLFIFLREFERV